MRSVSRKNAHTYVVLEEIMNQTVVIVTLFVALLISQRRRRSYRIVTLFVALLISQRRRRSYRIRRNFYMIDRIPLQLTNFERLVSLSDDSCREQLRMDRATFARLCELLSTFGGLTNSRYVSVPEKVAIFLSILAHHTKNNVVKHHFVRSGQTISKFFHSVLNAVLKLHPLFLVEPTPISEECTDPRWRCFQVCLGALDGTYIEARVAESEKPRYRSRKGQISVNVLGVCDHQMKFVYVLPGWEGSAADSRVLRDAISRPNGLKIPRGYYYLADNGYPNAEGILTPYKGVRYHLNEWTTGHPQNPQEYFNLKYTRARNVIERTFGLLKIRWSILRSPSFYPIRTHNRIIMACCLLHNYIRKEMVVDPMEHHLDEWLGTQQVYEGPPVDTIDAVQTSPEWTNQRDQLALQLYNAWTNANN